MTGGNGLLSHSCHSADHVTGSTCGRAVSEKKWAPENTHLFVTTHKRAHAHSLGHTADDEM